MNETEMSVFAAKHPPVMRVKVSKLKEIIDFLFSEGFIEAQIYQTPRILCHSINTIQVCLVLSFIYLLNQTIIFPKFFLNFI